MANDWVSISRFQLLSITALLNMDPGATVFVLEAAVVPSYMINIPPSRIPVACASTQVVFSVPGGTVDANGPPVTLTRLRDVKYTVKVTTSDVRGADTDGLVWMRLVGDRAESDDRVLNEQWDWSKFRRGQTDVFSISAPDVGALRSVVVGLKPVASWDGEELNR